MHQLRTLGTLELTSSGVPATSLLAQPRRTALFCYLALARPVGFKNRETLFALFWPEQEAESARHALRQSLYFLRRSLGSEILIARGDESVAVNPELLSCDLWAFDQSIRERRYAQAIELYEGELLPGFFISYAPGFERWLEDERARVHRSAIDAAWTLAEEAETAGEPDLALSWARRAAEMAPYDEAACRRLMLLLESQGERVAALRAFESFAALLQREHGFAPEEETLQLVERIRLPRRSRESDAGTDSSDGQEKGERESEAVEVPASTATPIQSAESSADDRRVAPPLRGIARSLRYGSAALLVAVMVAISLLRREPGSSDSPPLHPRPSIAVVPFVNLGPVSASPLADRVTDDLTTQLARGDRIRVASATSALALRNQPGDARAVGTRLNVAYILEGTVEPFGDSVRINARLIATDDGSTRWAEAYSRDLTQVAIVLDEVVGGVTRTLAVTVAGSGEVAAATPGRLVAHELYLQARDPQLQRTDAGSRRMLQLYQRAMEADSTYAPVHAGLAHAYLRLNVGYDPELEPLEAFERAEEAALKALQLDPSLAIAYGTLGKIRLHSFEFADAESLLLRALQLDPSLTTAKESLIQLYVFTGRRQEALELARLAVQDEGLSGYLAAELARVLIVHGDCGEAMRHLGLLSNLDPPVPRAFPMIAQCYAQAGDLDRAVATMRRDRDRIPYADAVLAFYLAQSGQTGEARDILETLLGHHRNGNGSAYPIAIVYAGLGEFDASHEWLEEAIEDRSLGGSIVEPMFTEWRRQPRFREILGSIGIRL